MTVNRGNAKHMSIDIPDGSTSPHSSPKINILDPREGFRYMQELSDNPKLLSSMVDSFSVTYKAHKNVRPDELEKLIQSTRNPSVCALLGRLRDLKENETMLLESSDDGGKFYNSCFIYGHLENSKYDILNVTVAQVKLIRKARLWPWCIGGVASGCIVGALATPIIGVIVCGVVICIGGLHYKFGVTNPFTQALYGFTLKELEKNSVVRVSSDGVRLQ